MVDDFFAVLHRCVINNDKEDRREWIGSVDKKYNVKHAYSIISQRDVGGVRMHLNYYGIPKVNHHPYCSWRVLHNKLPTKERLIRLGIHNVNPLCVMCNIGKESVSHLFFTV